jgi:hypothetical protein
MTIGIGVLCSTQPKPYSPRPDAIVMVADTMGSTDTDSTNDLHKMLLDTSLGVYATCAGHIERCADLWPIIQHEISAISVKNHGALWTALSKAVYSHRAQYFYGDVVARKYMLSPGQLDAAAHDQVLLELANYDVGIEMIVGAFADNGQALLYRVGNPYEANKSFVSLFEFPGHCSIGSGAYNATMWLNYRGQVLGMNITQSAYHAYEAKKMASSAPTVNENVEILVATKSGGYHLTAADPCISGCAISLKDLDDWWCKYKPPTTRALGFP